MPAFDTPGPPSIPAHGQYYDDAVPYKDAVQYLFALTSGLESRPPVEVAAPSLRYDYIEIDDHNVWLFAEEGCTTREQMYASAFSSPRFGNKPRGRVPFRELYRLSDPDPMDISDWAESIRWAKEQWLHFNADTWTEHEDHLAQITQWRYENGWQSEVARNSMSEFALAGGANYPGDANYFGA